MRTRIMRAMLFTAGLVTPIATVAAVSALPAADVGCVASTVADHDVQDLPVQPDYAWVLFTFWPAPLNVTAGQILAITFPTTPLDPPQESYLGWGKAATDVYAGGVAWGSSLPWEDWADGSDFAFATYAATATATQDRLPDTALQTATGSSGPVTALVLVGVAFAAVGASRYGRMFWFRWNRLSGSYRRLTSTSRS